LSEEPIYERPDETEENHFASCEEEEQSRGPENGVKKGRGEKMAILSD